MQIKQKTTSPALLDWLKQTEHEARSPLADPSGRLTACAKALFVAGSKSLTHSDTYLQRYRELMQALQADVTAQVMQTAGCLQTCHMLSSHAKCACQAAAMSYVLQHGMRT